MSDSLQPLWTVAHQTPLSMEFARQEYWSGLPFPSPMMKVKIESEVAQSCLTPSDPMDCSLPGSSVHGICQARVLEGVSIAFSSVLYQSFLLSLIIRPHLVPFDGLTLSTLAVVKQLQVSAGSYRALFSQPKMQIMQ